MGGYEWNQYQGKRHGIFFLVIKAEDTINTNSYLANIGHLLELVMYIDELSSI